MVLILCLIHGIVVAQVTCPRSPTEQLFQQINTTQSYSQPVNSNNNYPTQPTIPMGATAQDIINQQNQQAMQQMGYNPPVVPPSDPYLAHQFILKEAQAANQNRVQKQLAQINAVLHEELPSFNDMQTAEHLAKTKIYREAFAELMHIQHGLQPFSVKNMVFIVENAYLDNAMKYDKYNTQVQNKVSVIKMLMQKEGIAATNNLGKNYIIQKLFSERILEYKNNVVYKVHMPFQYDFDDFLGDKDWTKMFVTKLLNTGKGQCHSMPLLYLILAEETHTKAWLSFAPEHTFIQFSDNTGRNMFNFETTQGNPVSYDWLMESGYINTTAIRNHIYLDTLSHNGVMGECLADMIMGYKDKFGYDDFIASMIDTLLKINPISLQGQMLKADIITLQLKQALHKAGNPPPAQIQLYPEVQKGYDALMHQYDIIDGLGYQDMPKDRYARWLASLNDGRHQQETQKLKTQIIGYAKPQH